MAFFFIINFAHIVAQVTDSVYGPEASHLPELIFFIIHLNFKIPFAQKFFLSLEFKANSPFKIGACYGTRVHRPSRQYF